MLSERLTHKRLEKKLTHQNMADKLGITRQAYGNYESGKRDLDTETLSKIADILDTTTDYLLGRTDNPSPKNTIEEAQIDELLKNKVHGAFFKDYLSAPEEKKEEMRQFLKFILEQEKNRKPGQRQGE
ncbi:helix-turn-helix transcriptional regulator [Paenibacillus thiaminolyticus]|uniref:helix-turn-helix domain-containing protein n=1 Tax=Paenibacillus thiaminolyticus TaxID=49283 RepID=UPI0035A6D09C